MNRVRARRLPNGLPLGYPVRRYRTEIEVPADRHVTLQLPPHFPEGRAFVTVLVLEAESPAPAGDDPDRHDIEWWDEFSDDREGDEPGGLDVRLATLES